MKHSTNPWKHDGLCHTCGLPTTEGNHEECGTKDLDDVRKRAKAKAKYKNAAKSYSEGKLPDWMYT